MYLAAITEAGNYNSVFKLHKTVLNVIPAE